MDVSGGEVDIFIKPRIFRSTAPVINTVNSLFLAIFASAAAGRLLN